MQQIADFHIHSRFSRACSRELTLKNLDKAGRVKGVQIIGTGDFTHPEWFREMEKELELTKPGSGLYKLKEALDDQVKYILTSEVALIYKDPTSLTLRGASSHFARPAVRRLHLVSHGPSLEAVRELNLVLGKRFNLKADGRPILGIPAPEFVKLVLSVHPDFLIYPAHIWTPWFSVFGSKSGFNSLSECFNEQTRNIFAFETGLSSDPAMNWRLPELDHLTLLSSSDAHSLGNIGREATIFDLCDFSYAEVYQAIKKRDLKKIIKTIEYYPEGGMYHIDGHRDCQIGLRPAETSGYQGMCPVCHKKLTIGVASRVNELARRAEGFTLPKAPGFVKLIELNKLIAESLGVRSVTSVKVLRVYAGLIRDLGSEFKILIDLPLEEIEKASTRKLAEAIRRMRAGEVILKPGYDGQYGEVKVFETL